MVVGVTGFPQSKIQMSDSIRAISIKNILGSYVILSEERSVIYVQ